MKNPYRSATTVAVVCLMVLGIMTLSASAWGEPPAGFHSPTPSVDEIYRLLPARAAVDSSSH